MTKRMLSALALAGLAACAGPTATPARRYLGTATPTTPGSLCLLAKAEAQIRNDTIILAPDEGTWILYGLLSPDGTVSAEKTTQAANKQPWVTSFDGRWTRDTITGTYKTPRCSFTVVMKAS